MTRILQITDCHLLADPGARLLGVDTADSLACVLAQALAADTPDLLLVTGDITHDGKQATYERFAQLVRSHFAGPVLSLPGNHDGGAVLAQTLNQLGHRTAVGTVASYELPGWCLLAMDSHQDEQPEAHVDAAVCQYLQSVIQAASQPVLLTLHHPLTAVGAPWLDKDCLSVVLDNGMSLLEWLGKQTKVRAVVFGHVHQAVNEQQQHLKLWGTPSTCFQFAPGSQTFTLDNSQPGYRWLTLTQGGEIHSQVERLSDYPLPTRQ